MDSSYDAKDSVSREGIIPSEGWDGLERFELGCGRSAEKVEFSEKVVGWGCLLFIVLIAVGGIIALLERFGL